jgi:hypothetical protein
MALPRSIRFDLEEGGVGTLVVSDRPPVGRRGKVVLAGEQGCNVAERMIEANGVELCAESFGRIEAPPVLLIMGISASMLWWPEGFCRLLAEGGRFVIRYDHRDTGRSTTYEPGRPG